MTLGRINTALLDYFVVIDGGGTLITGLVQGDFTLALYNPSGTEVSGTIAVTIAELALGNYSTTFTPDAVGAWLLVVTHATYFSYGKRTSYQVFSGLFDG